MEDKSLKRIDFDKILEALSEEASGDDARKRILSVRPSGDLNTVKLLLKRTSDAHSLAGRFGFPPFGGIKNVDEPLKRAAFGAALSTLELLDIASTLRVMRKISEWKKSAGSVETVLDEDFSLVYPNVYLEKKITSVVVSEDVISDSASSELSSIRRRAEALKLRTRERLEKMVSSQSYRKFLSEPVVTTRSGRFVVPVKAEFKNRVEGIVHDTSSSGSTFFIEPVGVVRDDNEINELKIKERREIDKILKELSAECGAFSESIIKGYRAAVELDVVFSKAFLAYKMKASLPAINDKGIVNVKRGRHPLIPHEKVRPIDVELGKDFDSLIITGPNTGGKTASLKTVGLLCAMTACGLMIPAADGSEISVFDGIYADIGDEQSIERSESTFSSHVRNIVDIIDGVKGSGLVLLDEIGAGTDPEEGAALAEAILEALRGKGVRIVATTHYRELKRYALKTPGVQSACCEFDVDLMRPTYRLVTGAVGSSNALAISERLGMNRDVLRIAREILKERGDDTEEVIKGLEKTRKALESEREAVGIELAEARRAKEEAAFLAKKLNEEKERISSQARYDAKRILSEVRAAADSTFSKLKELEKAGSLGSAQARSEIKAALREIESLADPVEGLKSGGGRGKGTGDRFKEGDEVILIGIGKRGVVTSDEDGSGKLTVKFGSLKTKIAADSLEKVKSGRKERKATAGTGAVFKRKAYADVSTRIDIRGKTTDDAILDLDSFIDGAVLSDINEICIIHGKGTGALRKSVHEYLKRNKSVEKFRTGVFGEGEDGVTIATVKR